MVISSAFNAHIKELILLKNKKYRDKTGLFLIEGIHLITEALNEKIVKEVIILEGNSYKLDVKSIYVTENVMKKLSDLESTPRIMAVVCKNNIRKEIGNNIIILDSVQDPGNIGTIIRSAVAFNASDIILSSKCADVYSPKVLRSCGGMIFHSNIIIKDDLLTYVKSLKESGYTVFGTKVDGGIDVKSITKPLKKAIIIGNEGQGVSENLLDLADSNLYINMNSNCESLNAAVAASILMYEVF